MVFQGFFAIWLFASKIPKSGQDASQNGLKLAILSSKMAILGASWRQVGQLSAILAPTWLILVSRLAPRDTFFIPFSEIFGGIAPNLQNATQIVRKSSENCLKNASNMVPKCSEICSTSLFCFFLAFPMLEQVIKFRASRSNAKQVYAGSFFVLFRSLGALGSHLGALGPHLVAKLAQDGAKMTQPSST